MKHAHVVVLIISGASSQMLQLVCLAWEGSETLKRPALSCREAGRSTPESLRSQAEGKVEDLIATPKSTEAGQAGSTDEGVPDPHRAVEFRVEKRNGMGSFLPSSDDTVSSSLNGRGFKV